MVGVHGQHVMDEGAAGEALAVLASFDELLDVAVLFVLDGGGGDARVGSDVVGVLVFAVGRRGHHQVGGRLGDRAQPPVDFPRDELVGGQPSAGRVRGTVDQ